MQDVVPYHLRQVVFLRAALNLHQVVAIHILLPSHVLLAVISRKVAIFGLLGKANLVARGRLLGLFSLLCMRDWSRDFELCGQVVCVDELKDDVFQLAETPPDFEGGIVAEGWELGDKALNLLVHHARLNTIQIDSVQLL